MGEQEIDLKRYIETLWKWRVAIVALTGIAVVISGVFSFFVLSPVYETRVTLLVSNAAANQQSVRQPGDGSVVDTVSRIPTMTLNTYMGQLTSPYFLKTVIDRLGLSGLDPTRLGGMVSTQILKDTNLMEVRIQDTDKELAVKIANAMASEFVRFVSESSQERMTKSLVFLNEQKVGLLAESEEAYARLKEMQSGPNNVSSLEREISSNSGTLSSFKADLARAQVQQSLLTAGIAQLDDDLARLAPKPDEAPSATYSELLKMKSLKGVQLVEVTAEIAGLSREIFRIEALVTAMESRLSAAQNTESKARADLSRIESTLSLLETRMAETQMARSLDFGESTISVVSPALEPTSPVKPRKMLNMAVAAVLGGFLSVLLAFVLEYMDNTVKNQEDVMKYLNLGTLGAIPVIDRREID